MVRGLHGWLGVGLGLAAACGADPTGGADGQTQTGASSDSSSGLTTDVATSAGPAGASSSATTSDPPTATTDSGQDSSSSEETGTGPGPIGPFDPACPEPDLDAIPEWVPPPGTWAAISDNTLADVDPCPTRDCAYSGVIGQNGVVAAWSGGAFACHEGDLGGLVRWGGGHNDYWGNEVYLYDLATRTWERRSEPSDPVEVADPENGEVADGSPSVFHTYEMLEYHPETNSLLLMRGQSIHNLASANGAGHLFSFETNTWRRTALIPAGSGYGGSAFDRMRGVFWAAAQFGSFVSYDPGAPEDPPDANERYGAATEHHNANISLDTVAAIDANRDLFVILDLRSGPNILVQDLSDPASAFVETNHSGALPSGGAGGFEWVSEGQRFYAYDGPGETLYALRTPEGDWQTETWQWETVAGGGSGPPTVPNAGVYGAFRWAPAIQSFVVHGDQTGSVYAYRPDF